MSDTILLLERDDERAQVLAALRSAGRGSPALVLVEGAAGLGKTALLRAIVEDAPSEVTVLTARPAEHEAAFAYGVVRQLLGADRATSGAPREDGAPWARLGLGAAALAADGEAAGSVVDGSFGVLDALYWHVAERAARTPLALVVDDAHWADPPSLRFLDHLRRRIDGLPIAMLLALRPDEPGTPTALLDPLRLDPRAEVVRVRPLTRTAVRRLVADDAPGLADACHTASAGNPLYLRELLRTLAQEGGPAGVTARHVAATSPATVARHVGRRVAALGPEATVLADAMVVLGDGAALAHAAAVAELDPATARRRAVALRRMGVLRAEDPVWFEHPVVRAALRAGLDPAEHDVLARRAVAVLERAGAPAEQVARHLLELPAGGGLPIGALRRAADEARGRGAPDVAMGFLRRALAEPPPAAERADVLHDLGTVEEMLGDEACWEHLDGAVAAAPDLATRAAWTVEVATARAFRGGSVPAAMAMVAAALDTDGMPPIMHDRLGALLCALAWGHADGSPRADALLTAYTAEPPAEPAAARLVLAVRAGRMAAPADEVGALAEAALADGGGPNAWFTTLMACGALVYADRLDVAADHLDTALGLARASGNQSAIGTAHAMLAELAHATGDLVRCETHARLYLGPLRDANPIALAYTTAILVRALVDRGELDEADAALAEFEEVMAVPTTHVQYFLRAARGRLRCAQGRFREGADDLAAARRCLRRFAGTTWSPIGFDGGDAEPLALAHLGRAGEARELVAACLPAARAGAPPRNRATTLRAAGLVERGPEGVARLEQAVDVLEGTGARLEQARTFVALGTVRLRESRRADARAPLERGHDLALDCGARPLAERARAELATTGARPRRSRLATGADALTPSELRLARLAADGHTNREIAQDLYLAQKTVEMHLSRAYQKLGIRGRTELRAALEAS